MENSKKKIVIIVIVLLALIAGCVYFVFIKNNEYTVTIDSNGGSLSSSTVKVVEGSTIASIEIPKKNGYEFLYWTSDGKPLDSTSKITKDMKLVAVWQAIKTKITVTLDNNGGVGQTMVEVYEGSIITNLVTPTKEGYKFLYWELDGKQFELSTPITKSITLKAVWEQQEQVKKTYTVTFNTDGGSDIKVQTIEENGKATKPANPTKKGYTFVNWQLDGKDYDFNTTLTADITLKAVWKKTVTYTVTFNSNGGSSVSSKTVTEGSKVSKPSNPTKSGYAFVSWQLDGKDYNFSSAVTKNITLIAKWRTLNKYTVTFNSNGGSSVSSKTVTEGSKVSKPSNPTKSGYTFNAWLLNGKTFNFSTNITSNITLVAKWTAKTYVIEATKVDAYSPTMKLTIKENGTVISNAKVCSNGVALNGMTIAESSLSKLNCVILSDGTQMPATVK